MTDALDQRTAISGEALTGKERMSETPVPEMVERVAKAISGAPFPSPASYRKARAAIEAMREPTEPMIDKAWEMLVTSNLRHEEVYRYLIDAALTSPSPAEEG